MSAPLLNTESISTIPTNQSGFSTEKANPVVATETTSTTAAPAAGTTVATNSLKKDISTRVFCLCAISGSIGAGLLIASGTALRRGGPGGLVLAFSVVGSMVWCVMLALGELAASFPVQGSFCDYSARFISASWGFAMGANYIINFALIVAFEITVMLMIAQYWVPAGMSIAASGLVGLVPSVMALLAVIQAFGAKGYGEAEHVFGILKVLVLMTFTVTGIVIASGGTEKAGGRGFENWQDGKSFLHGLPGFLSVFVAAGMAYGGTEMLGLTVAECKHPRKVMPLGAMLVLGRIVVCFLVPLVVVGFVLAPSAFREAPFAHLHAVSPFVVAVDLAGLPALGHAINAVLLLSVFSMGNAAVFATSRAMVALARRRDGGLPPVLARVSRRGVPWNALGVVFVVAQLAWIAAAPSGGVIFEWLMSVASMSNYLTWVSICVCHIRLRKAMRRQGRGLEELEWRSPLGVAASYYAIVVTVLCMLAQVVSSSLPPVLPDETSRVQLVLRGILGFVVVVLLYAGHLVLVARKQRRQSWRERLWVPLDSFTLPELDARKSGGE